MPIFEYVCEICEEKIERLVLSCEEEKVPICPICKVRMKKVFSKANFKGEKDWNRIDIKKGANVNA